MATRVRAGRGACGRGGGLVGGMGRAGRGRVGREGACGQFGAGRLDCIEDLDGQSAFYKQYIYKGVDQCKFILHVYNWVCNWV